MDVPIIYWKWRSVVLLNTPLWRVYPYRQGKLTQKHLYLVQKGMWFLCNCMYFRKQKLLLKVTSVCRPQGPVFQIPEAQRPFLVHQGDIVTIAYNSFKRNKIPFDPLIVRKRDDLRWDDVLNSTKPVTLTCMWLIKDRAILYWFYFSNIC